MNEIIHGDCLDVMAAMPDNSVDSIVTDPPYGLAFMGKNWDKGVPGKAFWVEALRVAKPGAHILAFGGTRTYHRLAVAIEDAGWEIRDMIQWVYGSGFPKSHNLGSGFGTALKPANEPICLARKPFKGTVAANFLQWGTGGINIDGCRVDYVSDVDMKSGSVRFGVFGKTQMENSNSNIVFNTSPKINFDQSKGRFPANFIHDGSDEVLALFPKFVQSGGGRKGEIGKRNYLKKAKSNALSGNRGGLGIGGELYYDEERDDYYTLTICRGDSGSAGRFFYCAKASKSERNMGLSNLDDTTTTDGRKKDIDNPFQRGKTLRKNGHPTVKPLSLMRYLCRLITPPGGVVLDPFSGSGTTLIAAKQEGFGYIGIELSEEYVEIAEARLSAVTDRQNALFATGAMS
jgi:site-specific DNA-methyltransferase (adenine-specific)